MSHNWLHTPDCKVPNESGDAAKVVGPPSAARDV